MLLKGPNRDGAAGEVDPGRGDLKKLGRPATGPMQGLAQGPDLGGLTSGGGEEGCTFFGVQIEPVSGGVVESHFGHNQHYTRILLNRETLNTPLPCRSADLPVRASGWGAPCGQIWVVTQSA